MDPKHRDRIAFVRVCSGKFERDMTVHHSRSAKKVRLSSSHKLFGNERETVDEAYPGDVIGLVGHDSFGIGDTLTTDPGITYKEIPRFTPEAFSYLHNPNTAKFKQFRQGLDQLLQEGVIQALYLRNSSVKTPLLAAVGPLQFEVVQFRLESEYGAASRLEAAPWTVVRWLPTDMNADGAGVLATDSRYAEAAERDCPDIEVATERQLEPRRRWRPSARLRHAGVRGAADDRRAPHGAGRARQRAAGSYRSVTSSRNSGRSRTRPRSSCWPGPARSTAEAFAAVLGKIEPGRTERSFAVLLERSHDRPWRGRLAFDTIVASGPNGAIPHHSPRTGPSRGVT